MIRKVFLTCLLIFSICLNILLCMENADLHVRLNNEKIKRMDEKFQRNHPGDQKIIRKYPIVV